MGYVAVSVSFSFMSATTFLDHWDAFPLMFLVHCWCKTQPPRKMVELMRLMLVHCAPRSTPPHFGSFRVGYGVDER